MSVRKQGCLHVGELKERESSSILWLDFHRLLNVWLKVLVKTVYVLVEETEAVCKPLLECLDFFFVGADTIGCKP